MCSASEMEKVAAELPSSVAYALVRPHLLLTASVSDLDGLKDDGVGIDVVAKASVVVLDE